MVETTRGGAREWVPGRVMICRARNAVEQGDGKGGKEERAVVYRKIVRRKERQKEREREKESEREREGESHTRFLGE